MKYNILIVEDDADIIELLTLYLDSSDFHVFSASNGEEALQIAASENISVALVDIMMPKINGYEFIKTVRQNTSFPIIIVSAKTMDVDEVLGLNLGADAYIKKPFNPLVVVAQVKAVLRRTTNWTPRRQTNRLWWWASWNSTRKNFCCASGARSCLSPPPN